VTAQPLPRIPSRKSNLQQPTRLIRLARFVAKLESAQQESFYPFFHMVPGTLAVI